MAHQRRDAGRDVKALLLARKNKRGADILASYRQMGLNLQFEGHDYVCGVILDTESGWTSEQVGNEIHIYGPGGVLRVVSFVDFCNESASYASVFPIH